MAWYLVGSIGWIRYALPALAVMGMFTAKLLADLSHNFSISRKALQIRSASDPEVLAPHSLVAILSPGENVTGHRAFAWRQAVP